MVADFNHSLGDMEMQRLFMGVVILVGMLFSLGSAAQEVSFRNGVITGISSMEVPAQGQQRARAGNSATSRALGRTLGRFAGRAMAKVGGGEFAGDAYDVASGVTQDALANTGNSSSQGGMVTVAMIIVRFDNGEESGIQMPSSQGLRVGQKVRVFGSGSGARVVPQ
ncbi:hypothetical protein [Luteimonas sp. e5]